MPRTNSFFLKKTHVGSIIGVWLLGFCISSAQTASPPKTVYALCTAATAPAQYIYMTDVFSVDNSVGRKLRESWEQYVRTQYVNINVGTVNCGASDSQEKADTGRQNAVNSFNQAAQKLGAQAPQLVTVQWQYQQTATQTAAPAPAAAAPAAPAAASANPVQSISNSTTAAAKTAAKTPEQALNQSVQTMETSSTNTVTGAATTATNSINTSVQQGINKFFHKPVTTPAAQPAKAAPAPTTTATATTPPPPSAAKPATPTPATAAAPAGTMTIQDEGDGKHSLLMVSGQSDAQELTLEDGTKNIYILEATGDKYIVMPDGKIVRVPHPAVTASAPQPGKANGAAASTTPHPAVTAASTPAEPSGPTMTIQDEGDGKHSLLMVSGQSDAQELTLENGTKNVYLQPTTGDKYIVMPDGKIVRVPHPAVATASK